jgi:hypothetical protein
MAGTSLIGKPLPPPVSEFAYASVIEALGLQTHSEHDRVDALLKVPVGKILALFPPFSLPLMPVVDGDLIPGPVSFPQISSKVDQPGFSLPGKKWCEELLIGNCQFDVSARDYYSFYRILKHVLEIDINTCRSTRRSKDRDSKVLLPFIGQIPCISSLRR